ncbi:MAG: hypothetical protein V3U24_01385 [Candidatus Neomarinimicrobiota bacterium]
MKFAQMITAAEASCESERKLVPSLARDLAPRSDTGKLRTHLFTHVIGPIPRH